MRASALVLLLIPSLTMASVPETKVDPAVEAAFERVERQIVLVEVVDPLGSDSAPGCSDDACVLEEREQRRRARESDLAERKAYVIQALQEPRVRYEYPGFRLMALDVDRDELAVLAAHSQVVRIHFDKKSEPALSSSVPYTRVSTLHQAAKPGKGAGTAVAVLDSSVRYANGAFGTCSSPGATGCKVAVTRNFSVDTFEFISGKSDHGTNVAGIVLGMAPDTKILSLNVFHWDETAGKILSNSSDQVAALNWVKANAATYGIVAANMSIGGERTASSPCNTSALYDPVRTLFEDHGILVAIASGNDSQQNSVSSPGCVTLALTVGAQYDTSRGSSCTNPYDGQVACFSNLNGAVDLIAPGVSVTAGGTGAKSGTSMATPHVAGAIAAWQSAAKASSGEFIASLWMHRYLQLRAIPLPHGARRFQQLNLDENLSPAWSRAASFQWFYKESGTSSAIGSTWGNRTLALSGNGWRVGGVYLHLEVVHPLPQEVEVRVTAPDGKQASLSLPAGQANFNGVIGRMIKPGALEGLVGSPVDGTWTLALRDPVSGNSGHYISGTLFFLRSTCTATCGDESCGDDLCGGDCGMCFIGNRCVGGGNPNPANGCQACLPTVSFNSWTVDNTRACNDGNACTQNDFCQNGVCKGGSPLVCPPPPNACRTAGTCSASTGECIYPARTNGTACDDQDACTRRDTCVAGACVGSNPVTCPAPGACHLAGTCQPATGLCTNPVAPNGTSCNDGNACTRVDRCVAGTCSGESPVVCSAIDACHEAGVCNPASGICSTPAKADGTGCDDGNACTLQDRCRSGVCGGTPVVCDAIDSCHLAGSCDPATGACSQPAKADGMACDDGDGCTQVDRCLGGTCVGGGSVVCEAPGACKAARCDSATGSCVVSDLEDGVACDDGNACTDDDSCRAGVCAGTPVLCVGEECRPGVCDPRTGACASKADEDGTRCSLGRCEAGVCTAPPAPKNDGVSAGPSCGCSAGAGDAAPGLLVPGFLALAFLRRRREWRAGQVG